MAHKSRLSETAEERYIEVVQQIFVWRRQRLSVEQLGTLIEVGETLLPTVYLPELDLLKEERVRVDHLLSNLNQIESNYAEAQL